MPRAGPGSCIKSFVFLLLLHLVPRDAAALSLRPADALGWKVLIPLAIANLVVTGIVEVVL